MPLPRQLEDGGVGGGHRLQVVHHAGQAEHLVAQRPELLGTRLGDAVEQGLVPRLEDSDRRAQLMGDARDQVPADLVLVVERVRHVVERGGELAKLTGCLDLPRPRGAVAAGHRPGHRDQPGDGAGDPPGEPKARDEREQGSEPGGPGDGPQQRGPQDRVGAAQAGRGQLHLHRAFLLALDQHGRTGRGAVRRGEAAGRRHGTAAGVPHLKLHARLPGEVADQREVGVRPALVLLPRAARHRSGRVGQLIPLPARERGHVDGGEDRGEDGDQRDRHQRHAEERERQPQAQGVAAVTAARGARRTGRPGAAAGPQSSRARPSR